MIDQKLSASFYLSELVVSDTAARYSIDNTPHPASLSNMRTLLAPGLQKVRDLLGVPVIVSSGYRGPALNKAIRGSATSQHMVGMAADFSAPGFGTPLAVCKAIVASSIQFDQLIHEGTWVHISFSSKPRREVLTAHFGPKGTTYTKGLS